MHTPAPWHAVRFETGEYYTHSIETIAGQIASIAGWSTIGTVCPTTEANARLIEHAPDLAAAVRDLLSWADQTGGWEAPCWGRTRHRLARAIGGAALTTPGEFPNTRDQLTHAGHGKAWNDDTELGLVMDFLNTELARDPGLAARLESHLRAAAP